MHIRESGRKVDSRITIGPSLRVIGVIDLLAGRAVHARAGDRAKYGPVRAVGGHPVARAGRKPYPGVRADRAARAGAGTQPAGSGDHLTLKQYGIP